MSLTLTVAGRVFSRWSSVRLTRDLKQICGVFELDLFDGAREMALASPFTPLAEAVVIQPGLPCQIAIDGEPVLRGWIEDADTTWADGRRGLRVRGRDMVGDLVECSAFPDGPAELRNIGLLEVARRVCQPFGITVRAETDLGAPFSLVACYPHETALSLLEKLARQRGVLVVSDGVGGLVFTRAGVQAAASPLRIGELIQHASLRNSWRGRFSRIVVKGQSDQTALHTDGAALGHGVAAAGAPPATPTPSLAQGAAVAIVMQGSATDPAITRYRPSVRMTRTQSGMSTLQEQAEWAVRVARGQGYHYEATVLGWRAGPQNALWRPNTLAAVWDPYAPIDEQMIISRVVYQAEERGLTTHLTLEGKTAFDRVDEAVRRTHRRPARSVADAPR
jgi:prophage tail gpP-like protein